MKQDHGFRLGGSGRGGENLLNLGCLLKVEPAGFAAGLVWGMREKSKVTQGLSPSNWVNGCDISSSGQWGEDQVQKENKRSGFRHVKFEMTEKARRIEFRAYNQAGKQKMVDQCITVYYKV